MQNKYRHILSVVELGVDSVVAGPNEVWVVSPGVADVTPGDNVASWDSVLSWVDELPVTTVRLVTRLVVEKCVVGLFVVG